MTVTQGQYGQWVITEVDEDGYLITRQYFDYTRQQAIKLFNSGKGIQ